MTINEGGICYNLQIQAVSLENKVSNSMLFIEIPIMNYSAYIHLNQPKLIQLMIPQSYYEHFTSNNSLIFITKLTLNDLENMRGGARAAAQNPAYYENQKKKQIKIISLLDDLNFKKNNFQQEILIKKQQYKIKFTQLKTKIFTQRPQTSFFFIFMV